MPQETLTNLLRNIDVVWTALNPRQQASRLAQQVKTAQGLLEDLEASLASDPSIDEADLRLGAEAHAIMASVYGMLGRKAVTSFAGQEFKNALGLSAQLGTELAAAVTV